MSHIITLIANPQTPLLSTTLLERAVEAADTTRCTVLQEGCAAALTVTRPRASVEALRAIFADMPVDIVLQKSADRKRKKLLIADMDSTMIMEECIDELAAQIGIKDHVSAITARAMNGEIAFDDALRERVGLLADMPVSVIEKVIEDRIHLRAGARQLVQTMKRDGAYCALVSGGFTSFTSRIADMIGFDENRGNALLHADGKLTGKVGEPILGSRAKLDALNQICASRGIAIEDTMAVGDGANDLEMINAAGMGVALHAKPKVAEQADIRIDHGDLTALLFIQGYRAEEFVS